MARASRYRPLEGGGYEVERDDGSTFPTAYLPPDLMAQLGGPVTPSPELLAAAAPGEDLRTAQVMGLGIMGGAGGVGKPPASLADAAAQGQAGNAQVADVLPPPSPPKKPAEEAETGTMVGGGPPLAPRVTVAPTRVIKGGEMKVGETDVTTSYDPQSQANLRRAQQNEYEAGEKIRDAAVSNAENTADMLGQVPGQLQAMEDARKAAEEKRQLAIDSDHAELEKLRAETKEGISDPMQDRDTGAKVVSAIAIAMGAAGAGLLGRPNDVAQMMDRQAQNAVDIQKANLANKRARFEDKRLALADNMKRFQDARQSEIATKGQFLEIMQSKAAALAAEGKTEEERARGAMVLAGIQKAAEANDLEFSKVTRQIHTRVVPDRVVGGAAVKSEADPELFVPEAGGFALRKDAPPEMNKRFAAVSNIRNLIAQAKRIGSTVDQRADPAARAELQSISGQLVVALKEANQMGALDKGTQEVSAQITGDPAALLGIGRDRVLDGLSRNMQSTTRSLQRAYGILPGSVQVVTDPTTGQRRAIGLLSGEQLNEGTGSGGGQKFNFSPMGGK